MLHRLLAAERAVLQPTGAGHDSTSAGGSAAVGLLPTLAGTASFALLDTLGWLPLPGPPHANAEAHEASTRGRTAAGTTALRVSVEELQQRLLPHNGVHLRRAPNECCVRRASSICARHISAAVAGAAGGGGGGIGGVEQDIAEVIMCAAVLAAPPLVAPEAGCDAGPLDHAFVSAVVGRHGPGAKLGHAARAALWRVRPGVLAGRLLDMVQAVASSSPLLGLHVLRLAIESIGLAAICARHLDLWVAVAHTFQQVAGAAAGDWRVVRIADIVVNALATSVTEPRVLDSLSATHGASNAGVVRALLDTAPAPTDAPDTVLAAATHVAATFAARLQAGGDGDGDGDGAALRYFVLQRADWVEVLFGALMLAGPERHGGPATLPTATRRAVVEVLCWLFEGRQHSRGGNNPGAPASSLRTTITRLCAATALEGVVPV